MPTDDLNNTQDAGEEGTNPTAPMGTGQNPTPPNSTSTPFDEGYVKSLRSEAKDWRVKAQEAQQKLSDLEREALAQKEDWKALADNAEAKVAELQPKADAYDALIVQLDDNNKARIKDLPSNMASLVPEYDDPVKTAAWLDKNMPLLSQTPAPNLDGNNADTSQSKGLNPTQLQAIVRSRKHWDTI